MMACSSAQCEDHLLLWVCAGGEQGRYMDRWQLHSKYRWRLSPSYLNVYWTCWVCDPWILFFTKAELNSWCIVCCRGSKDSYMDVIREQEYNMLVPQSRFLLFGHCTIWRLALVPPPSPHFPAPTSAQRWFCLQLCTEDADFNHMELL